MGQSRILTGVILAFLVGVAILVLAFLSPLKNVHWGKVEYLPAQVVTVTGEAKTQTKNQVASFTAGVNITSDNKDEAISQVNTKTQEIIDSLITFGIPQTDIKTQNLSIYQSEDFYTEPSGVQRTRPGQWRASNSVEIKLKDIDRASELADLLGKSGATQVYGPNFALDDTGEAEKELLEQAIADAREKAEIIAKSSGKSLGEVMSVTETGSSSPIYPLAVRDMAAGGGGAVTEPGTNTVYKSVSVIFELK